MTDEPEITEEKELPKRRIKSPSVAWSIAQQLLQEDLVASQDRAVIDGLIDGKPPYDQADLDEAGQADRVNVNPKDAAAIEDNSLRSYYDLVTSTDNFGTCKTKFGDNYQRPLWCTGICEEFTEALRRWNLFQYRIQNLQVQYVRHGVGIAYREDEINWMFRTCGLEDWKIRRNTPASEEECDLWLIQAPYTVEQLYKFTTNEGADEDGWDVEQVKALVLSVCDTVQEQRSEQKYQNWEMLERQLKENDLYYGGTDYHIWINHVWVREYDGTITHIMVPQTESAGNPEKFMYENRCRFENVHQAFTAFTYGVGGGTYHTIRGLGWKIFDQEQAYARLWNTAMDGAMANSVTMIQPKSGANVDLNRVALSFNGPFAVLPGGYEAMNRTIPDFSKAVIPVLSELKAQIRNNTSSYQGIPSADNAENMPVKNYQAYLAQENQLSESALDLWYGPWQRLMAETFRRMANPDYLESDPGYAEVLEFRKRVKMRGIPLEALYQAYDFKVTRAVGAGSKMARIAAFDQAIALGGSTDEEGRYNLVRDRNALVLGHANIDRYWRPFSMTDKARFSQDEKNASFENFMFNGFTGAPVSASDNHAIHCAVVDGLVSAIMEQAMQGGEPNVQDLEFQFKVLQVAVPHFAEHVQYLSQDSARQKEAKYYNRQVQKSSAQVQRIRDQIGTIMQNQQKQAQAEQERAIQAEQARIAELEEKASAADSNDPKANMKLQKEIMDHHVKMRMKEAEFAQNQKMKSAEMAQKLAFKDAETAVKLLELSKQNPYEV